MDSINNACKFGSDAWLELQAFKTRQLNRREKLNRHKNLNQESLSGISLTQNQYQSNLIQQGNSNSTGDNNNIGLANSNLPSGKNLRLSQGGSVASTSIDKSLDSSIPTFDDDIPSQSIHSHIAAINAASYRSSSDLSPNNILSVENYSTEQLELVECLLLLKLCDVALKLPIDSGSLLSSISKVKTLEGITLSVIENLLQKLAHQELISIEESAAIVLSKRNQQLIGSAGNGSLPTVKEDDESRIYVTSADHTKLVEFDKSFGSLDNIRALLIDSKSDDFIQDDETSSYNNRSHNSVPIQTVRPSSSSQQDALRDNVLSSPRGQDQGSLDANTRTNLSNNSLSKTKLNYISEKKQAGDDVESLLSLFSTRERENKKLGEELLELLSKPTAKEKNLLERFRSADGYRVQEFCAKGTKGECRRNNQSGLVCDKLHFKKIIAKHTEESLGDCSFLNTCFHMDTCKYVHYEVDYDDKQQHQFKRPHPADSKASNNKQQRHQDSKESNNNQSQTSISTNVPNNDDNNNRSLVVTNSSSYLNLNEAGSSIKSGISKYTLSPEEQARIDAKQRKRFKTVLYPPQWIQCDLRFFDMSLLGKFSVVMADPPWDIHMELPYGTMSDDEMRKLNIPALQDEGVIFLWVTGRAMELGRECLALWGYERCDEIIWVKTNQLQRIIRTGRTGHWLNHGKEHCLVGIKGNPKDVNRGLDCDVIVAEVRATSHKPDEIYGIIERLSPGTRKIELFGRAHNVQPNWITLGNQLNGVRLVEPGLVNAFKKLNLPFQTADAI